MKFVLNTEVISTGGLHSREVSASALQALWRAVKALYYFAEAADFAISEESYGRLPEDGKQYFIGVEDENKKAS